MEDFSIYDVWFEFKLCTYLWTLVGQMNEAFVGPHMCGEKSKWVFFLIISSNGGFGQTNQMHLDKGDFPSSLFSVLASWFLLSLQNLQNKLTRLVLWFISFFSPYFICCIKQSLKRAQLSKSFSQIVHFYQYCSHFFVSMISHCACIKCIIYEYIQIYGNEYLKCIMCGFFVP